MARRGHGEGSISRRKDGRYQAAITLENHKRKYFYGKTRKEVQDKLNAALHEQKQGMLATGPQQLLKTYLENWLEQVCKPTKRPNTHEQYNSIIHRHVIPGLGHITLQKLTPEKVQAFYAQKLGEGLSAGTIAIVHAALNGALENAVKWGLVSRNVAELVTLPRKKRYEAQILTLEQAQKLLEAARGSRLEALLIVALTTGMRRGELLALRWDDVDFENGLLYVRHTMNHITGLGYVVGEPKSWAGRRTIVLSEVTIKALRVHREQQEQSRALAGEKWLDQGIVFCNTVGNFLNPSNMLVTFRQLLHDAGLPKVRFHDLRHSAATILAAARVDLKTIQERLGHSTIATTADIYSHALPKLQQEAAEKIDEMFPPSS